MTTDHVTEFDPAVVRRLKDPSMVLTAAVGRRKFLRGLGIFGLMSGLMLAGLTFRFAGPANAVGSCAGGACGPSPLCSTGCSGYTCVGSNSNRGSNCQMLWMRSGR